MSANEKRERDDSVDIARGIAILFVVSGHCEYLLVGEISPFLFVMPFFYFIGGFFLSFSKAGSPAEITAFVSRKARQILLPFIVYMLGFGLATYLLQYTGIPWGNPRFFEVLNLRNLIIDPIFSGMSYQLAGALWFLPSLFIVFMLFACMKFVINFIGRFFKPSFSKRAKVILDITIVGIFICIYYVFVYGNITLEDDSYLYVVKRNVIGLCFCMFGYIFYKYKHLINMKLLLVMSALLYAVLTIQYGMVKYYHMINHYGTGIEQDISLFYSLAGIGMVMGVSSSIAGENPFFNKPGLIWLGKNSLHIMCLHLLGFLVLDLLIAYCFPGKSPADITSIRFRYAHTNWAYFFFSLFFCAVAICQGKALMAYLARKLPFLSAKRHFS
jgi:fucose 4-O-acetylase-like acetyltransferase